MYYDESRRGGARGPWLRACHVPRGGLRGARAARVEKVAPVVRYELIAADKALVLERCRVF